MAVLGQELQSTPGHQGDSTGSNIVNVELILPSLSRPTGTRKIRLATARVWGAATMSAAPSPWPDPRARPRPEQRMERFGETKATETNETNAMKMIKSNDYCVP